MLQDTSRTHLHTDHTDRSMVGVNAPSSADFDVRLDALRDALPRRISISERIDFQYITKTSSADPTARKQYATAETLTPKVRNPRKSVNT